MLELVRLFRHKGLIGASTVTAGLFITFNEYVTLHVVLAILFQFFTHLLVYPAGWVYAKQWCQLFGEKSVFAMFAMVTVQKTLLFPVLLPLLQVFYSFAFCLAKYFLQILDSSSGSIYPHSQTIRFRLSAPP